MNLFTIENIYESKRTNIPPASSQHKRKQEKWEKSFYNLCKFFGKRNIKDDEIKYRIFKMKTHTLYRDRK